jgi:4-amino-4-deoxy-L-arabinose transferase-like glycosyltransferase
LPALPAKHLLAAPLVLLLYFYGLTTAGMLGPDEPRYASIGREMAISGDWVTPRLWGQPWFEKPPLLYWMVALGFKAGLGDDLAPRLPVALLGAGFVLFFFHQLRREFGERPAFYASGILATSAGWLAYSHVAVTDIPLAATFSAALLLCLPWVRSGGRRGLFVAGLFLGLAMLAKGLVPIVLMAPLLLVAGRRWPNLFILAGAAILVAGPWFAVCYQQNGDVFVDEFIWKHHVSRFLDPDLQHVQPWWFYIPVMAGLFFPWTPMLALVPHKPIDNRRNLLLGMLLFGFVFFSASENKLPGYLLPLLPAAAALAGLRLAEVERTRAVLVASSGLLLLLPVIAGTLPEALARGLGTAGFGAVGWAALIPLVLLGLLVFFLASNDRRTWAMAVGFHRDHRRGLLEMEDAPGVGPGSVRASALAADSRPTQRLLRRKPAPIHPVRPELLRWRARRRVRRGPEPATVGPPEMVILIDILELLPS